MEPIPASPGAPSEAPYRPPTLYLNAKDLEQFGLQECLPGETYSATIKFRVAGVAGVNEPADGDSSKQIEITEMSGAEPENAALEPEAQAPGTPAEPPLDDTNSEDTTATLGYRRPKKAGEGAPIDLKKLRKS
jgi:hypothetical protein